MKVRILLSILVCRLLRFVSRLLHRGGTAMPGRIALKIYPDLLAFLAQEVFRTESQLFCEQIRRQSFKRDHN